MHSNRFAGMLSAFSRVAIHGTEVRCLMRGRRPV